MYVFSKGCQTSQRWVKLQEKPISGTQVCRAEGRSQEQQGHPALFYPTSRNRANVVKKKTTDPNWHRTGKGPQSGNRELTPTVTASAGPPTRNPEPVNTRTLLVSVRNFPHKPDSFPLGG